MKKTITLIFSLLVTIILLSGCGAKTIVNNKIDANKKSIIIGGVGLFSGTLRNEFKKKGWNVTTQYGTEQISGSQMRGNINIQKGINYKAKYSLSCVYNEFNYFDGLRYTYTCTMFDNYEGVDVFNVTKTSPPAVSMDSVVETIFELIEYDYSNVKENKEEYITLNYDEDTYFQNNKRFSYKTKKVLDGKYKFTYNNQTYYSFVEFSNGNSKSVETFDGGNILLSKSFYKNNAPVYYETYYPDGKLKGVVPLSPIRDSNGNILKDGEAEFYNEIGDIFMRVTYENDEIVKGTIYDEGKPRPMTKAHFKNYGFE